MPLGDEAPQDPSIDYIGTKLFSADYRVNVEQVLKNAPSVKQIIQQTAEELYMKQAKQNKSIKSIKYEVEQRADKIISEMIADMSSVNVTKMGIALPHIAAGDNLNMPGIGWVLRHNGAFFIRREWGGDKLYIAIMQEYVQVSSILLKFLLQNGFNIEAFIEGTRSRTGKLLQPKFGFLKLILESILGNKAKDAILVPVSLGYDKVIETPSYVNELLGIPKQKESIGQLLMGQDRLVIANLDVRFGKAFSMKYFINGIVQAGKPNFRNLSHSGQSMYMLQALGYRILAEINKILVIMPTSLVGTVLLTLRGRGVGKTELVRKVTKLQKEITARGGQVAESGLSSNEVIVDRAVKVLGELIGRRYEILEPVYYPVKRFELSYYRNQVIHLFVPESIFCVGMYATIKVGGPIKLQRIPRKLLLSDISFLSQLLKYEFVFGSGGVEQNTDEVLEKLSKANVAESGIEEENNPNNGNGKGEQWITLSAEERRTGRENFETYWLTAVSLYTILPDRKSNPNDIHWVDKRIFMKRSQIFGKTLYYEGDISYFESVNKETIGNAIARLKELGVIHLHKGPEAPIGSHFDPSPLSTNVNTVWIALASDWIPAESLPEVSNVEEDDSRRRRRNDWGGPIGNFSIVPKKSMYDNSKSISLSHSDTEDESATKEKYESHSSTTEIEKLNWKSSRKIRPMNVPIAEKDDNHNTWYQLRPKGRLWEFCEHIGRFRREGKNRRDTSTVANRVLRLAQLASQWEGGKKKDKKPKQKAKL
ncbi:hypothetical protein HDV04_004814 [Boothiomyces sp. JEL0838]|nr:hypothetical protein HDV04_004814 [Boothiomyces sp. JEL0838]